MILYIVLGFLFLIIGILCFAGNYFYNYAIIPSKKTFLNEDAPGTTDSNKKAIDEWFEAVPGREDWKIKSDDDLILRAIYIPNPSMKKKTAIIAHGYMGYAETMSEFTKMYFDLGYNVLIPDARGHGKSQGHYIGFGWHERKDYLQWIQEVLVKNGEEEELTLYGISMGAGTVMMTAGEKLPVNVVSIVEDCGYTSVEEELKFQLKEMFHLPAFPLVPITNFITKIRAGYSFKEADAVRQLNKNSLPMFFIHGDADTFVPFFMLDEVYQATKGPKEKWVVPGVEHALSLSEFPGEYREKLQLFLEKYPYNSKK